MADATPPVEDDKNQLNPTPKGGKKVFSKPVKIGFLDVEEGTLFKKKFRNKFCLLTDARELEWFRRQEDQVERKVQGSVKDMHLCTVDEVDDEYLGSNCCFSVKVHGKGYIFGAANDQERINWMVEILKLRSIQDIISLLNDPRLSRHAAYALCNQAGNNKGFCSYVHFQSSHLSPSLLFPSAVFLVFLPSLLIPFIFVDQWCLVC